MGPIIDTDKTFKQRKIDQFIQIMDQDGDGKVQLNEWLDFCGNLFDSVIQAQVSSHTVQINTSQRKGTLGKKIMKLIGKKGGKSSLNFSASGG